MQRDREVAIEVKGQYLTLKNMKDSEEQLPEIQLPETQLSEIQLPETRQPEIQLQLMEIQQEIQPHQTVHLCPVFSRQLR